MPYKYYTDIIEAGYPYGRVDQETARAMLRGEDWARAQRPEPGYGSAIQAAGQFQQAGNQEATAQYQAGMRQAGAQAFRAQVGRGYDPHAERQARYQMSDAGLNIASGAADVRAKADRRGLGMRTGVGIAQADIESRARAERALRDAEARTAAQAREDESFRQMLTMTGGAIGAGGSAAGMASDERKKKRYAYY